MPLPWKVCHALAICVACDVPAAVCLPDETYDEADMQRAAKAAAAKALMEQQQQTRKFDEKSREKRSNATGQMQDELDRVDLMNPTTLEDDLVAQPQMLRGSILPRVPMRPGIRLTDWL